LTWGQCPSKPKFVNTKGQTPTPLLLDYIQEMLAIRSIVPTSERVLQSRLFPVAKKRTTKMCMVLNMSRLNKFIPTHSKFQNLLGFKVGNQSFKLRAMPFGLNTAP